MNWECAPGCDNCSLLDPFSSCSGRAGSRARADVTLLLRRWQVMPWSRCGDVLLLLQAWVTGMNCSGDHPTAWGG